MVISAGIALKQLQSIFILSAICCNRRHSLRASSPIWASDASRGRTRERGAKRVPRASTFHDIPRMKSSLAGYSLHETVSMPKYSLKQQDWTVIFGIQLMQGIAFAF